VFGAGFSGSVTIERARESVIEACSELIEVKRKPTAEDQEMETLLKMIVELIAENNKRLEAIAKEMENLAIEAPKKGRGKKADTAPEAPAAPQSGAASANTSPSTSTESTAGAPATPKAEAGSAAPKAATEKTASDSEVTIETVRHVSTKYSADSNFGMNGWLELAQKVTGQKKVKDIPPALYHTFVKEMEAGLATLEQKRKDEAAMKSPALPDVADSKKAGAVTIETLRTKAAEYMGANGQPALAALLKAFNATKLSDVAPEKRAALLEAFVNV
jgi:hypothetical protein